MARSWVEYQEQGGLGPGNQPLASLGMCACHGLWPTGALGSPTGTGQDHLHCAEQLTEWLAQGQTAEWVRGRVWSQIVAC